MIHHIRFKFLETLFPRNGMTERRNKALIVVATMALLFPLPVHAEIINGATVTLTASDRTSDNTTLIQGFLNDSAYDKIVIQGAASSVFWRVRPLDFKHHHTTLHLGSNVILEALPGGFTGSSDSVIQAKNLSGISITGSAGSAIKMHKQEYAHSPNQRPLTNEWRAGIELRSCSNVLISTLKIANTGGDGIYIGSATPTGYCSDVTIQNVTIDGAARNGVSVTSVQGLTIKDSTIQYTQGVPGVAGDGPWAGIDFEPNFPTERLKDIHLRRCKFINNGQFGILLAARNLNGSTHRLELNVDDCVIQGTGLIEGIDTIENREGNGIHVSYLPRSLDDHSWVIFKRCEIYRSQLHGAFIGSKEYHSGWMQLIDCYFKDNNLDPNVAHNDAAIVVYNHTDTVNLLTGNISLDNIWVVPPANRSIPYVVKLYGEESIINGVWGDVHAPSGTIFHYMTEETDLTLN